MAKDKKDKKDKNYARLIQELTAATLKAEYASREKKVPGGKPNIAISGGSPGAIAKRRDKTLKILTNLTSDLRSKVPKAKHPKTARDAYLKKAYKDLKQL